MPQIVLSGWAVRWDDTAPSYRLRFAPGSLAMAETVRVSVHHTPWMVVGAGGRAGASLTFTDEGLWVRLPLIGTSLCVDALAMVQAGVLRGWSLEVWPFEVAPLDGGWQELRRGLVDGVSLVLSPAFRRSLVTVQREGV